MQCTAGLLALTLTAAAGTANGQSIEFRIIERNGETVISCFPTSIPVNDGILNFAVQARVVGGTAVQGLGDFRFDIVAFDEWDQFGSVARLLTSNADGRYAPNVANTENSEIGKGGLAAQYSYPATINADFNGLINESGGTFTNTVTSQEIGMISGSPAGAGLLLQTDVNADGNPDTYPGTGTFAPLSVDYARGYLGAGGNFVDVYRFKYTIRQFNGSRGGITFRFENVSAQVVTELERVNGLWGPVLIPAAAINAPANSIGFSFDCINCAANYNHNGGVSVQDVFDFLNDWFAGLPWTDWDRSGVITPQDIFAFLNAWFVGC